jgi:putative restriction endonuclease
MRYWWVNHKQTSKFEIAGGFLWSPMRKSNGASNYFYDTMRDASPGDAVISYSHAQIRYVGLVVDFATPALKPPSFGTTGDNWDKKNGWLLPVFWTALDSTIRPKAMLGALKGMLPSKYSPISPVSGNGNQGAYLSEVGRQVFELLIGKGSFDKNLRHTVGSITSNAILDIDSAIESEIAGDKSLSTTTKQRLIDARLGQGVFKERIYEFERSCRLTSVETAALLIASHIKPWRLCETALERLDGANGLLLTSHVDLLFDRGLISFSDVGDVILSPLLNIHDLELLGLRSRCLVGVGKFHKRQQVYLEFHRDVVFLSGGKR